MKPQHLWHRDKQLTREIIKELRGHWVQFDPLGVIDKECFEFDDEYDSYLGSTLEALKSHNQDSEVRKSIGQALDRIGIGDGFVSSNEIEEFTKVLLSWFLTVEKRTLERVP